ncbi:nucleoside hydrolase [Cloacibacillus sp.]|uniref:nucleoside hydrolase n=1 Tax=Cloacibacillus sp. TaxID=2049023 RepID=UPI0025B94D60|nr:nucleoside hydrolase [Cloacibacillus sp.]
MIKLVPVMYSYDNSGNLFLITLTLFLLIFFVKSACAADTSKEKELVILDSDMVEIYDDGMAMAMLALSSKVELLGVSVVAGNTWVEEGTAFALRQLEGISRAETIPVAMGVNHPLRGGRLANMKEERELFGFGRDNWQGAGGYPRPESWRAVYKNTYRLEPQSAPLGEHAADFIIEQVKKYPGRVTIAAIGPCGNIAEAVRKAPEIVPLVKRVVYMGGAFFQEGNVTPAAEFNCWFDPEAAKIALRSPFKEQIIVPLDVCEKVKLSAKRYAETEENIKNPVFLEMVRRNFRYEKFKTEPDYVTYIWDTIVSAIIIDPTVITEEITLPVDVNDDYSLSYGQMLAFKGGAPRGAQSARIVLSVDEDKLWKMIFEVCRGL